MLEQKHQQQQGPQTKGQRLLPWTLSWLPKLYFAIFVPAFRFGFLSILLTTTEQPAGAWWQAARLHAIFPSNAAAANLYTIAHNVVEKGSSRGDSNRSGGTNTSGSEPYKYEDKEAPEASPVVLPPKEEAPALLMSKATQVQRQQMHQQTPQSPLQQHENKNRPFKQTTAGTALLNQMQQQTQQMLLQQLRQKTQLDMTPSIVIAKQEKLKNSTYDVAKVDSFPPSGSFVAAEQFVAGLRKAEPEGTQMKAKEEQERHKTLAHTVADNAENNTTAAVAAAATAVTTAATSASRNIPAATSNAAAPMPAFLTSASTARKPAAATQLSASTDAAAKAETRRVAGTTPLVVRQKGEIGNHPDKPAATVEKDAALPLKVHTFPESILKAATPSDKRKQQNVAKQSAAAGNAQSLVEFLTRWKGRATQGWTPRSAKLLNWKKEKLPNNVTLGTISKQVNLLRRFIWGDLSRKRSAIFPRFQTIMQNLEAKKQELEALRRAVSTLRTNVRLGLWRVEGFADLLQGRAVLLSAGVKEKLNGIRDQLNDAVGAALLSTLEEHATYEKSIKEEIGLNPRYNECRHKKIRTERSLRQIEGALSELQKALQTVKRKKQFWESQMQTLEAFTSSINTLTEKHLQFFVISSISQIHSPQETATNAFSNDVKASAASKTGDSVDIVKVVDFFEDSSRNQRSQKNLYFQDNSSTSPPCVLENTDLVIEKPHVLLRRIQLDKILRVMESTGVAVADLKVFQFLDDDRDHNGIFLEILSALQNLRPRWRLYAVQLSVTTGDSLIADHSRLHSVPGITTIQQAVQLVRISTGTYLSLAIDELKKNCLLLKITEEDSVKASEVVEACDGLPGEEIVATLPNYADAFSSFYDPQTESIKLLQKKLSLGVDEKVLLAYSGSTPESAVVKTRRAPLSLSLSRKLSDGGMRALRYLEHVSSTSDSALNRLPEAKIIETQLKKELQFFFSIEHTSNARLISRRLQRQAESLLDLTFENRAGSHIAFKSHHVHVWVAFSNLPLPTLPLSSFFRETVLIMRMELERSRYGRQEYALPPTKMIIDALQLLLQAPADISVLLRTRITLDTSLSWFRAKKGKAALYAIGNGGLMQTLEEISLPDIRLEPHTDADVVERISDFLCLKLLPQILTYPAFAGGKALYVQLSGKSISVTAPKK